MEDNRMNRHTLDWLFTVLDVYLDVTVLYGFTRAVTYNYEGSREYYNKNTRKHEVKEMLLVDKIGRITSKTFAAVFMWPRMLHEDLTRAECAMSGKNHLEYKWIKEG